MEIVKRDDTNVMVKSLEYPPRLTEADVKCFRAITSQELTPEQVRRIVTPLEVLPRQDEVLAIHWHPEYVPMDLIRQRIEATFPCKTRELIIPTQHNVLMEYGDYSGVEVDCYSHGFQRKVQLLLHFRTSRLESADVFKSMLDHTFRYRSSQLYAFLDMVTNPKFEDYLQLAAEETGVDEDVVRFSRIQAMKLRMLLDEHEQSIPRDMIKNKLIREFITAQADLYPESLAHRAQVFLKTVKRMVKENFSPTYFYRTSEFIEEARALGGGVVVPHPEQFWPILLADYDVDGYEVWNPQSQEYTEFLVNVINRQNKSRGVDDRSLLVFMGDDTHMTEKLKDPAQAEAEKYYRDIGVQPAWDDLSIRKSLIVGNASRARSIEEYRARLDG
ncbi:hypothetical protein C6366_02560 [Desulfonatronum sp. SC1]|nr:hypothetical protein C6366_02560 [Desulfonatronum sp. SC1]